MTTTNCTIVNVHMKSGKHHKMAVKELSANQKASLDSANFFKPGRLAIPTLNGSVHIFNTMEIESVSYGPGRATETGNPFNGPNYGEDEI